MKKDEKKILINGLLGIAENLKSATKACEEIIAKLCDSESDNTKSLFLPCPICGEIPVVEVEKGKVFCEHGHFGILMIGHDFSEKEMLEALAKEWNTSIGKIGE
jgi:hypothetical protein